MTEPHCSPETSAQRDKLATAIESGELALVWCHPQGKFPAQDASSEQSELIVAALRGVAQSTVRDRADYKIGAWLSAALEDPAACAEFKADIHAWFEAHQPGLISDTTSLSSTPQRPIEKTGEGQS